jgi:hypothetical protein
MNRDGSTEVLGLEPGPVSGDINSSGCRCLVGVRMSTQRRRDNAPELRLRKSLFARGCSVGPMRRYAGWPVVVRTSCSPGDTWQCLSTAVSIILALSIGNCRGATMNRGEKGSKRTSRDRCPSAGHRMRGPRFWEPEDRD